MGAHESFLAKGSRERCAAARGRLLELHKRLNQALVDARRFGDPNLSAEGNANRRAKLEREARDKYLPLITELSEQVAADVQLLSKWADSERPATPGDAVGLQKLQIAWDRVRGKLDAGMRLPKIIASADEATLLAIREWAPDWLEAENYKATPSDQHGLGYTDPDTGWIGRAVDARFAELAGGDFAQALAGMAEAEQIAANVAPIVGNLQSEAAGGPSDAFAAAIGGRVAAEFVKGDYAIAAATDGPDAYLSF